MDAEKNLKFEDRKPPRGMLNKYGRRFFGLHFRGLVRSGILTEQDFDTFVELCKLFGEKEQLSNEVRKQGHMIEDRDKHMRKNPNLARLKDVESKVLRLLNRFGLDPTGRATYNRRNETKAKQLAEKLKLDFSDLEVVPYVPGGELKEGQIWDFAEFLEYGETLKVQKTEEEIEEMRVEQLKELDASRRRIARELRRRIAQGLTTEIDDYQREILERYPDEQPEELAEDNEQWQEIAKDFEEE